MLCSLAIAITYEVTRPIIARNKIAQRRLAILDVIPQATSIAAFRFDSATGQFAQVPEETEGGELVFAGFDASGDLVGVAKAAAGSGYQDSIQLLYGYLPSTESVIGIRVLESRETPGLGDRIETDPNFLQNFDQLDVRVSEDGERLEHEITFVKPGEKTDPLANRRHHRCHHFIEIRCRDSASEHQRVGARGFAAVRPCSARQPRRMHHDPSSGSMTYQARSMTS